MIGKLKGLIEHIYEDHLIIDVNGIGYIVNCSSKILLSINIGTPISLYIQMIVKEDQMSLYGFLNENDKASFNFLQTVQGVGAKVALGILNHFSSNDIYAAVMAQDISAFRQVSGIGPKLAERIVNELKSSKSLSELVTFDVANVSNKNPVTAKNAINSYNNFTADAISALVALGYNRKDAYITVQSIITQQSDLSVENIIKLSLKAFSGS